MYSSIVTFKGNRKKLKQFFIEVDNKKTKTLTDFDRYLNILFEKLIQLFFYSINNVSCTN